MTTDNDPVVKTELLFENRPIRQPCNCERFGCPNDHSEHFRRKAALRRVIEREVKHDHG